MEKKQQTDYNDVFLTRNLLANIPLVEKGARLPKETMAAVMLLRVAYGKRVDEFEADMAEVLRGLKKEGYDERAQAVARMEDTDRRQREHDQWDGTGEQPAAPTDEERRQADETRAAADDFRRERAELEEAYMEARRKKAAEPVAVKNGRLTQQEYADVCGLLGAEGDMDFRVPGSGQEPVKMPREYFLGLVAASLVAD